MLSHKDNKLIRSLSRKKDRDKNSLFIIEGKRVLAEALTAHVSLQKVYCTSAFLSHNQQPLINLIQEVCSLEKVEEKEMKILSPSTTPPGILGLCPIPEYDFKMVPVESNWLYLDGVSDPGNMGTLLRTAAWFGVSAIGLSKNCTDPYNPKVVQSGMGGHFHLNFLGEVNLSLLQGSHTILGADQRGKPLKDISINKTWVLVLGSEAHGLSAAVREVADHFITIPKYGAGESLNVGIAAGIMLHGMMDRERDQDMD